MASGTKMYNLNASFEGTVDFKKDVTHNGNKVSNFIADGMVVDGTGTSFPVTASVGQLYFYQGAVGPGIGLAEYRGGLGTDYPAVTNSTGWYSVGKIDLIPTIDLTPYVKKAGSASDVSNKFTGRQGGVAAVNDDELTTLGQVKSLISPFKYLHAKAVVTDPAFDPISGGVPSSSQTDGITLSSGQKALVCFIPDGIGKKQELNGLWVVQSGAWIRADEANTWDKLVSALIIVEKGNAYGDTIFLSTIDSGGILDTDPISISVYPGIGEYSCQNTVADAINKAGIFKETVNRVHIFKTLAGNEDIVIAPDTNYIAFSLSTSILSEIHSKTDKAVFAFPATLANATCTIAHGFDSEDLIVKVKKISTNEYVEFDIVVNAVNIVIVPVTNISAGEYEIIVVG